MRNSGSLQRATPSQTQPWLRFSDAGTFSNILTRQYQLRMLPNIPGARCNLVKMAWWNLVKMKFGVNCFDVVPTWFSTLMIHIVPSKFQWILPNILHENSSKHSTCEMQSRENGMMQSRENDFWCWLPWCWLDMIFHLDPYCTIKVQTNKILYYYYYLYIYFIY